MPMIARPIAGAALAALLAVPLPAQTIIADLPAQSGTAVLVPFQKGSDHPTSFVPTRRGAVGRPRNFARLHVQLVVEPFCSLHVAIGEAPGIRCSVGTQYQAAIRSDADADFAATSAFASAPSPRAGLVAATVRRLTVEY